ncbi:hypothetical protein M5W75_19820 [Paenibacillus larvae]|nr:hypothetical protein [Paenibacillus larvae]MCY9752021.1 hypothetical protein [Paenibacillus larvae]
MNAAEAAWLLYCQVEEGRTMAELVQIGEYLKTFAATKKVSYHSAENHESIQTKTGGQKEMNTNTKQELVMASEETLLTALNWAKECLDSRGTLPKEEAFLLEKIVFLAAEIVSKEHYQF